MGQIIICWQTFIFGQFRCLQQTENHFTDNAFSARCGGAGEDNDNDNDDNDNDKDDDDDDECVPATS